MVKLTKEKIEEVSEDVEETLGKLDKNVDKVVNQLENWGLIDEDLSDDISLIIHKAIKVLLIGIPVAVAVSVAITQLL